MLLLCRHIKQPAASVADTTSVVERATDDDTTVLPSNAAVVDDNNPPEPSVRRRAPRPSAAHQRSFSLAEHARCGLQTPAASVRLRKTPVSLVSLSSVFCCREGSGYPNGYPVYPNGYSVLGNSRGGFP